jgi:Galactose-3-O-sulfotransferase
MGLHDEALSTDEQLWRDLRPPSNDPTVIFVHIGRTAGTTLARILGRTYPRHETHSFPSTDIEGAVAAFRSLPLEERERFRLLKGHIMFGIHDAIPRPFTYITLIRDPVDRLISHYFYILQRPEHRLHARLSSTGMSFEDFVRSGITLETDNWQARSISGMEDEFGCCGEDMLKRATQNILEHFSVCGITDLFDETLVLMHRALNWEATSLYYGRENATDRPRGRDVPRRWIAAVEDQNPIDLELYAFARARLERLFEEDRELRRESQDFHKRETRYEPLLHVWVRGRNLKNRLLAQARRHTH